MTKNKKLTLLLLLFFGIVSKATHAAILFGHDSGNGSLYEIDTAAQSVTPIGSDSRGAMDIELAYDQTTIFVSDYIGSLALVDSTTGLTTDFLSLTGFPGSTDSVTALELVGSTLYAAFSEFGETSPNYFGLIDVETGEITWLGFLSTKHIRGLHFVENTMFAVSGLETDPGYYSNLYSIDLATGATNLVSPITLGGLLVGEATGLAYKDGKMYLIRDFDSVLYSLHLETGVLSVEFDTEKSLTGLTAARTPSSNQISIESGFIKLDTTVTGHSPFAADCSDSSHFGRMTLDAEGSGTLFVCTESGWQQK